MRLLKTARHAIVAACSASVVVLLSCEAIVNTDTPQFTCEGTGPAKGGSAACPPNQYCNGSGCKKCETVDVCDHLDNDCNGLVDDGRLCDNDMDSYTWCGKLDAQGHPYDIDCDDNDPAVYPGAPEICDGKDNNCDGLIDNGATCPSGGACIAGNCVQNPCSPDGGLLCPGGETCDPITHTCVSITKLDIGAPCTADSECTSPYFCAQASVLGASVLPASGKGMCTQDCCASNDCPQAPLDFVCYAPGQGSRFCVDPAKLGRPASLGSELAGASETSAARCRSGAVQNGRCADTCCTDSNCTGGTACGYGTRDTKDGFYCLPNPGNGTQWSSCSVNTQCRDELCVDYGGGEVHCVSECCGSNQCGTVFGLPASCNVEGFQGSNDHVALCSQPVVGIGAIGASCSVNTDCYGNVCYSDTLKNQKYCSDACCIDSNCPSGYVCRPAPSYPRCIKQ